MAYDNFTLDILIQQFSLRVVSKADVFAEAVPLMPSVLLRETLAKFLPLALKISTEKAWSEFIIAPLLAVVEAKNESIKIGLAQCMAEMPAAQKFNAKRGTETPTLYGVVTTGSAWKFLRLSEPRSLWMRRNIISIRWKQSSAF